MLPIIQLKGATGGRRDYRKIGGSKQDDLHDAKLRSYSAIDYRSSRLELILC